MSKLWAVIEVLYQGKSLSNPETWKHFGVLVNIFGVIVASLITLVPGLNVSQVDQDAIVKGLATLAFVLNGYIHVGSTEKIGLSK